MFDKGVPSRSGWNPFYLSQKNYFMGTFLKQDYLTVTAAIRKKNPLPQIASVRGASRKGETDIEDRDAILRLHLHYNGGLPGLQSRECKILSHRPAYPLIHFAALYRCRVHFLKRLCLHSHPLFAAFPPLRPCFGFLRSFETHPPPDRRYTLCLVRV